MQLKQVGPKILNETLACSSCLKAVLAITLGIQKLSILSLITASVSQQQQVPARHEMPTISERSHLQSCYLCVLRLRSAFAVSCWYVPQTEKLLKLAPTISSSVLG